MLAGYIQLKVISARQLLFETLSSVYLPFLPLEIIITAGGENIAPVPIEDHIKAELPLVASAMVIGDKRKFLSCLLTLQVFLLGGFIVNFEQRLSTFLIFLGIILNIFLSAQLTFTCSKSIMETVEKEVKYVQK